jgi:hypothetical protein
MLGALWICAAGLSAPAEPSVQDLVDELRREHGLPAARRNAPLERAAAAHVRYMLANETTGHSQSPGHEGYVARTPGERARHFGYVGANSEAVAWGDYGPRGLLRDLFDAPYHRVLFLQPKSPDLGAAFAEGAMCVKFGGATGDGAVLSPPNGARDVPRAWDGVETPDPLRNTNLRGPVGYPIVLALFGSARQSFRFVGARLVGPAGAVPAIVLHPGSDRSADGAVILVPHKPLAPQATYTVTVNYRDASGEQCARATFSTSR